MTLSHKTCFNTSGYGFKKDPTVITLNIGTPRPATIVVLNIKQFNFTLK